MAKLKDAPLKDVKDIIAPEHKLDLITVDEKVKPLLDFSSFFQ